MKKRYTDRERLDLVKQYRIAGTTLSEFASANEINRSTLKDWVAAYNHLQGEFVRIDDLDESEGAIIKEKEIRMNLLKESEIRMKSSHFSRFDHSIVIIETEGMKVTTSLEQALKIVELIHDRL